MKMMWSIGIKSGVITFLGLIAYGLLIPNFGLSGLEYVVLSLGIYSGHYYYKAANNNLMSYGQGLKLGLIIVSFTGFINGLIMYFIIKHTDPVLLEKLTENVQKVLQKKGISAPIIEETGQLLLHMSPVLLGLGIFFSTVLLGFSLTLLVSVFSRSSPRTTSQEE